MRGSFLKTMLEDVADNLFNRDPYYQQGGDMVRTGGLSYVIRPDAPIGERISDLTLSRTGAPIEAAKSYAVAGWASVNEGVEGPPIWEVVAQHLKQQRTVKGLARSGVTLKRG
jgi:sulfur-oxidizing protein SoxB